MCVRAAYGCMMDGCIAYGRIMYRCTVYGCMVSCDEKEAGGKQKFWSKVQTGGINLYATARSKNELEGEPG